MIKIKTRLLLVVVALACFSVFTPTKAHSKQSFYVAARANWPTIAGLEIGLPTGEIAKFKIFGGYWQWAPLPQVSSSLLASVGSLPSIKERVKRQVWQLAFIADFYPIPLGSAKGFKVSVGMIVDSDKTTYENKLANNTTVTIGGESRDLPSGATIKLEAKNSWIASPYVGIGYDVFRGDGLIVNFDFGLVYTGGIDVKLSVEGGPTGLNKEIQKDKDKIISKLKLASLYAPFKIIGGVSVGWQF